MEFKSFKTSSFEKAEEKIKKFPEIDIEDEEEAKEAIKSAIEKGEMPIISIPEKYVEAAKKGIKPNTTWIGEKITAGTILREPYLPKGEKRRLFRIKVSADQLIPRFTKDNHFQGVVVFKGPIPSEIIEEIPTL